MSMTTLPYSIGQWVQAFADYTNTDLPNHPSIEGGPLKQDNDIISYMRSHVEANYMADQNNDGYVSNEEMVETGYQLSQLGPDDWGVRVSTPPSDYMIRPRAQVEQGLPDWFMGIDFPEY